MPDAVKGILAALFSPKGVNPMRLEKAKGAAMRSKVDWSAVLAAMTKKQRAKVDAA